MVLNFTVTLHFKGEHSKILTQCIEVQSFVIHYNRIELTFEDGTHENYLLEDLKDFEIKAVVK